MKIAFYTTVISPHQLPFALAISRKVGVENYRYIYTEALSEQRRRMGWLITNDNGLEEYQFLSANSQMAIEWLHEADVVLSAVRDLPLFEYRVNLKKLTIYISERWFKPPRGILRLLVPTYFKMAKTIIHYLWTSSSFYYFPLGIHAARDMARLCGLFSGDIGCLWRVSRFAAECKAGGRLSLSHETKKRSRLAQNYLSKMRMWGYFTECSSLPESVVLADKPGTLHVLWVGRMLSVKRVDVLLEAVIGLRKEGLDIRLTLVGGDGEKENLMACHAQMAQLPYVHEGISFVDFVPMQDVRTLMRQHDVYVLPSDGGEGWGCVLNEAFAEGMCVVGTYESGAAATLINDEENGLLFHAGDVNELTKCLNKLLDVDLQNRLRKKGIEQLRSYWSPEVAANMFVAFVKDKI